MGILFYIGTTFAGAMYIIGAVEIAMVSLNLHIDYIFIYIFILFGPCFPETSLWALFFFQRQLVGSFFPQPFGPFFLV